MSSPATVLRRALVPLLLALGAGAAANAHSTGHPLDGLSIDEHRSAIGLLRAGGHLGDEAVVASVHLHEPEKAEVLAWSPGRSFTRHALVVFRRGGEVHEATVDLRGRRVVVRQVPGVHSQLTDRDYLAAAEVTLAAPEVQAMLAARGVTDLSTVICFAAAPAISALGDARRVLRMRCAERRGARSVAARVLEGIDVLVDVDARRVARARDLGPSLRTEASPDFDAEAVGPDRAALPPRQTLAPEGQGFRVDGGSVSWAGWRFHLRTDPRVGLVLSTVTVGDGPRQRPVLYQANLAEIFVPYMDPAPDWYDRAVLDASVYAHDGLTESLSADVDCPADAVFVDGVTTDELGESRVRPRVACLFERHTGLVAWRKGVENTEYVEGRPARELVVRMVATIGNYDYLFDWVFQRDGTLRVNVGATGQVVVKVADGDTDHGRRVADGVVAVHHDHYFAFRLDLDVDGPVNSFVETRLVPQRLAAGHPRGAVWVTQDRIARTEGDATQDMHPDHAVLWRVVNPATRNAAGHATGYELRPGHSAMPIAPIAEIDAVHRWAGFVRHPLWVTAHAAAERYPAGDYPMLAVAPDGLPAWTRRDRPIERADLVLWYTVGMHHVVRTEDWPVMPVTWHGFELRPFDFFDRNPALDLPRRP